MHVMLFDSASVHVTWRKLRVFFTLTSLSATWHTETRMFRTSAGYFGTRDMTQSPGHGL